MSRRFLSELMAGPVLARLAVRVLLAAGGFALLTGCRPLAPEPRTVPLQTQAYIWQRAWKPEILDSIRSSRSWIGQYDVLAAEMRLDAGKPKVTRMGVDKAALLESAVPVGLVIRIFPSVARTGWDAASVAVVVELAEALVRDWPAGSLKELQLDYDCPESKLPDFTRLLKAVKVRLASLPGPVPVTCTALPSWLKQAAFSTLAREVPGYVLQVHSLHLPESRDRLVTLVDLPETDWAVKRVVEIGVPFRVALPTYSCVVEFDAAGKVREVYAEDVPVSLPLQSSAYVVLDADALALSDFVNRWRREASPLMTGVIWYRLPVAGDRMNWPLEVFRKVAQGEVLKQGWQVRVEPQPEGHAQVVIEATGDVPEDLPRYLRLSWPGGAEAAADGLGGYRVKEVGPGFLTLELMNPAKMPRAMPGVKRVAGWLRVEGGPVEVSAGVEK